jgi:putative IMPACT (imprinted ancient) family translation regulator
MLEVLLRRELTDVAAVVTRWFGGIKLGAGGLVRAYGRSVSEAVDALGTLRRVRHTEMLLAVEHAEAGRVQNALLTASCRVVDVEYGADAVLTVQVPSDEVAPFRAWLAELTAGTVEALITREVDVDVPG